MSQAANVSDNKKMYLIVKSAKQSDKKIPINKDTTTIGSGSSSDIAFPDYDIAAQELLVIKKNNICVLRSLTEKGFMISRQHFTEKILEPDELISVNNLKLRFKSPFSPFLSDKLMIRYAIINDKILRKITIAAAVVIALLLVNAMTTRLFLVKEAKFRRVHSEKKHVEKELYAEEDFVCAIAEARNNIRVARQLEDASETSYSNLSKAALKLCKNITDLESMEPQPEVYQKSKDSLVRVANVIRTKVDYLKNNAYIAIRVGNKTKAKDLLAQIMNLIVDPANDDYIWAKEKYISIGGK